MVYILKIERLTGCGPRLSYKKSEHHSVLEAVEALAVHQSDIKHEHGVFLAEIDGPEGCEYQDTYTVEI